MDVGGKIFTGAAVTALLALVGHYATADDYVSGLEKSAQTEMKAQGMDGVSVAFSRDPLSRHAILDGDVSDAMKQKALNAVSSVNGVSSARWAGSDMVAGDQSDVDPETKAAVTQCQDSVNKVLADRKITFRSGSAYVSSESNKILDTIATTLKPCAGMSITVGGHTDSNGNAAINKSMSQERADRIRAGLIDRGLDAKLIIAKGFGAEQPIAKEGGAAADARNRRIEFTVNAAKTDANAQQGE